MPNSLKHRILDGIALSFDLSQPESNTAWHKLALEGSWKGHWMGPFSLNAQMLNQIVEHQQAKKIPIVVDYEHASVFSDMAPAAGWLNASEARKSDDGQTELYGQIEWTDKAADYIRAKEYRFLSPTIVFNTRDRKSGEMGGASLHSVALTNKPFLEELPEVRLNSFRQIFLPNANQNILRSLSMNPEQLIALATILGLATTSTFEQIEASVRQLSDGFKSYMSALSQLGLQPGAKEQDVLGAILKLQNPAERVSMAEFQALKNQIAQRDASDLVANAQRAGKVTADGTDLHKWAVECATKSPEMFKSWVNSAPKLVDIALKTPAQNQSSEDPRLSDDEMKACKAAGISVEDYIKYNK